MRKRKIDFIEFSRKGGNATKAKYGSEHYSKIRKKANKTILKRYGKAFYLRLSRLGVESRRKKREELKKNPLERMAEALLK